MSAVVEKRIEALEALKGFNWLRVPRNDKEYSALEDVIEHLMLKDPKSPIIKVIAEFMSEYESNSVKIPEASGVEALKFLMDQHGLRQVDLVDVFGNQGNVSSALNQKRGFSVQNIKALSKKFNVNPAVFI
ncbi:MAG: transcriptional regulator [Planctomycetes bacterium]|nr:transcriptional regulator [Planctomycetota bacterium]